MKKEKLLSKAKAVEIHLPVKYLFSLLLFTFYFSGIFGQANFLLKKNDASFDNITLEEAFHQLTIKTGCQFSFNASILPLDKKVNQKFNNKTLLFILTSLLSEYDVGFKEIKNQIIIFQLQSKNGKSLAVNSDKKGSEIYHIINIYDTIRQTIIDTFEYVDTIRIYDTIKIYDKLQQKNINKKIKYPYVSFEPLASAQINLFELENKSAKPEHYSSFLNIKKPAYGFSFGPSMTLNFKNFLIQSGLFYDFKKEKYEYTATGKGEVMQEDSVKKTYYVISKDSAGNVTFTTQTIYNDTVKWVPNNVRIDYQLYTSYHFLQIPLLIGYKPSSKKDIIEFKGGIITDVLLLTSGKGIFSKDTIYSENAKNLKSIYTKINFSLYLNFSYNFYINRKTYFLTELFYYRNLNSIYNKSFWYSQKFAYPGIRIGLRKIIQ